MPNAKYLWSFRGLVDAIELLGRDISITQYLEPRQQDPDDPDEWAATKASAVIRSATAH
jgi:hypothetical protein